MNRDMKETVPARHQAFSFFSLSTKEHQPALHYHHNDKNITIITVAVKHIESLHTAVCILHTSCVLHWRHIEMTLTLVFVRACVS